MLDVHGKYSVAGFSPSGYLVLGISFMMLAWFVSEAMLNLG